MVFLRGKMQPNPFVVLVVLVVVLGTRPTNLIVLPVITSVQYDCQNQARAGHHWLGDTKSSFWG